MRNRFLVAVAGLFLALAPSAAAQQQQLDRNLDPNYGSVTLEPNFRPNPHQVSIVAGGDMQASNIISGCIGWVTGQPDFRLTFRANGDVRALDIRTTSAGDTTLIVQGPDYQWSCNDDANGMNPAVTIAYPQSGDYAIWVGTYVDEDVDAVLSFTEHR
jgi:hypothetical protein